MNEENNENEQVENDFLRRDSRKFKLCISGSYSVCIKTLLATIDSDKARNAIRYLDKCAEKAYRREEGTLYKASCKLDSSEIVNGEIVQIINALKFYESIYEPKTAAVLKAARELIYQLITYAEKNAIRMHRARTAEREAKAIADAAWKGVW